MYTYVRTKPTSTRMDKSCIAYVSTLHYTSSMTSEFLITDSNVIVGTMASQITNLMIVYSAVYLRADQIKHHAFIIDVRFSCAEDTTGRLEVPIAIAHQQRYSFAKKWFFDKNYNFKNSKIFHIDMKKLVKFSKTVILKAQSP